jgi:hypothetical protein
MECHRMRFSKVADIFQKKTKTKDQRRLFIIFFHLMVLYFDDSDAVNSLSIHCKLDRNVWVLKYKLHTRER